MIPSSPPFLRRALAALVALLCGLSPLSSPAASLYRPPSMEKDLFDTSAVDLKKFDRAGLVSNLVSVARDFNEEDHEVDFKLRAHALAIAGRLDPDSKKYADTRDQLLDKARTIPEDGAEKSRVAGRIYSGVRALMRSDSEASRKCAAFCIDIGLELDPSGKYAEKLQSFREELQADDIEADWAGVLQDPVQPNNDGEGGGWWGADNRQSFEEREERMPGGEAKTFKSKQSQVYGLVVITLGNGKHAGAASSIIATALRDGDVDGLNFKLNQKVGPMMANSLESITAFLQVNYEDTDLVPAGYMIDIVFEDKDTLTDGPSAGTAMALLLESLFTGEELDKEFACTGGITPAGQVTKIGGVAAKIRGATRRDCTIVGVPEDNAGGVADILVLNGIEQLLEIQIFSMEDIDQARAISRAEKSSEVQSTLDDFEAVAAVIKSDGEKMLQNLAVQKKLEDVLEKMPNHLSAKLLLQVARDKAPSHLTVGGSFHEIDSNASGVFSTAQMMAWREKYQHDTTTKETAQEAIDALKAIEGKVDERMEDYLEAAIELSKMVHDGRGDDDEEDFLEDLEKGLGGVRAHRTKLMNDPELQEELRS